jgi:hypothetical protein
MQSTAQRLVNAGLPMVEFPQSVPNLTESSTNLYELIKARNLIVHPDDDLRLAISRAVALETGGGWKIANKPILHSNLFCCREAKLSGTAATPARWGR